MATQDRFDISTVLCYSGSRGDFMDILITGFEPVFAKYDINPSWEAVQLLPETINGAVLHKLELPCRYGSVQSVLEQALEAYHPQVLLSVGHSGRTNGLEVEQIGINRDDCSLPDNDGILRQGTPICPDGADAYFSNLPIDAMVSAIRQAGIPAGKSYTAGQYLCNHALYLGRYLGETHFPGLRSGFLHVPLCARQAMTTPNAHTMELDVMAQGLQAALTVLVP